MPLDMTLVVWYLTLSQEYLTRTVKAFIAKLTREQCLAENPAQREEKGVLCGRKSSGHGMRLSRFMLIT